jgi:hypothetical protein
MWSSKPIRAALNGRRAERGRRIQPFTPSNGFVSSIWTERATVDSGDGGVITAGQTLVRGSAPNAERGNNGLTSLRHSSVVNNHFR